MKYARNLGWYLLVVAVGLTISSVWQLKRGSGQASFSFVIVFPFAIGLLRARKWAVAGTGAVGVTVTLVALLVAVIHSLSGLPDLTISLGPIVLRDARAGQVWALVIPVVAFIGLPMCGVLLKLGELDNGIDSAGADGEAVNRAS